MNILPAIIASLDLKDKTTIYYRSLFETFYFLIMKKDTHPQQFVATVACASCKTTWQTGSTKAELNTEICSQCHPFFTGKQHLVDTAGTVERFQQKQAMAAKKQESKTEKKPRKTRAKA